MAHQKRTYNAESNPSMIKIIARLPGDTLNMLLLYCVAFGLFLLEGSISDKTTMMSTVKKKTHPMLVRNGITYFPLSSGKAV